MAHTLQKNLEVVQGLIDQSNTTTGKEDTTLTNAVNSLVEGYGQGGSDFWRMYDGLQYYNYKFAYMTNLETIPYIDTSLATDCTYMFYNNKSIQNVSNMDLSKCTNFSYAFSNCPSIQNVSNIDLSNCKNFTSTFTHSSITDVKIKLSKATLFNYMFSGCDYLTNVTLEGQIKPESISSMFTDCTELKELSVDMDTSNCKYMNYLFEDCGKLETIPFVFDLSKVTDTYGLSNTFKNMNLLKNVKFAQGSINVNLPIRDSSLLSDESIQSIIDGLADRIDQTARTLTLHADVKAKLTDEQKETITNKNWTLA